MSRHCPLGNDKAELTVLRLGSETLSLCMLAYHLYTLSKPVSPNSMYPCKRPAKVQQISCQPTGLSRFFQEKSDFLDEFVPIWRLLGDESAGLQALIDAQAGPCIDGCVTLLGIAQLGRLPVGELLVFADLLLEKDGIDLLQAHVGDAVLLDQLLQFDESGGMDVAQPGQLMEIVGSRETHLNDAGVLEVLLEWGSDARFVQADQKGVGVGRELQQGDAVPLAALEAGACLGVKACDGRGAQGGNGTLDLRNGGDDVDAPGKSHVGHLVHVLFVY